MSFYSEMAGLEDERRGVDVVKLDFGKTINIISDNIPVDKQIKYSLDK